MLSDIGIATRNSPLALKQTHAVIDALKLHFPKLHPTIHEVHTRKPERLDDCGLKGPSCQFKKQTNQKTTNLITISTALSIPPR